MERATSIMLLFAFLSFLPLFSEEYHTESALVAAVVHNINKTTNPCGTISIWRFDVDEIISWCWAAIDHSERRAYFSLNDATNHALKSQMFKLSMLTNTGHTTKVKGVEKTCAQEHSALLLLKKSKGSHVKTICMKSTASTIKSLTANFQNIPTNDKQKILLIKELIGIFKLAKTTMTTCYIGLEKVI
jgi:hypothetical protein